MRVVHLLASPFFGGPERQVLGLSRHLPGDVHTSFLSFAERGLAQAFLDQAAKSGFEGKLLAHNTPRFFACVAEVAGELRRLRADLLCTSGYKPDLVGWRAARRVGIPVVAIAHGWTGATWKVRFYEWLDRCVMRRLDAVVAVSQAQAARVRAAGVAESRIVAIQNAVGAEAFTEPSAADRAEMLSWFAEKPRWLIGTAARFSPEKGLDVLIAAAARVARERPGAGFVLFGEGPMRRVLEEAILANGLTGKFVLAGFRSDMARFLPNLDLHVMSSYTEGLPIILLEAGAAGVASVATSVGGIPEVVNEHTGLLAPPADAPALATHILALLADDAHRQALGRAARERVRRDFSFAVTSLRYHELFRSLVKS